MRKRLLLIILLLALLPTVLAEFTIDTLQETKESCPTEINLFTIPITNTGLEDSIYTVSLSGSAAKWAVAAPPGFVLSSGDSQTIFVYVTPPKNTRIGDYRLDININDGKTSESVTEIIIVKECFGVELLVAEAEETICSCEETDFLFKLTNTGEWVENYRLSVAGSASKWASISEEFVRLQPSESKNIKVHVAHDCSNVGIYGLTLTAKSESSEAVASANVGLGVKGCYDFNAYPEQNYYSFCENSEIKVPITIENKGSSADEYVLSVVGPSWTALDKKEVIINGGGGASVSLVAFPTYGVSGNYPAKVNVVSLNGGQKKVVELDLNVLSCYSTVLNIDTESDSLCLGTESQHKVIITNAGNFDETYALSLSGAEWASLSQNSVVLGPSESKNIDLSLSPRIDTTAGEYDVIVTAQSSSDISDSVTLRVEVLAKEKCFGENIIAGIETTEVEYGGSSLIPITVENLGVQKVKYTLDMSGNGASYAQLNPSALEVEGGKSKKTYLYIYAPEEAGQYSLVVSARDESGVVSSSSEIKFDVIEEVTKVVKPDIVDKDKEGNVSSDGFTSKISGAFGAIGKNVKQVPYIGPAYSYLEEHWYFGIGLLVVIVLIIVLIFNWVAGRSESDEYIDDFYTIDAREDKKKKKSAWQRFKSWLNAEDLEEFEIGWDIEERNTSEAELPRASTRRGGDPEKAEKRGAWSKFKDWLEEEVPEEKPKKKKKEKKKSAWGKFSDWLNEGELLEPEPEDEVVAKKSKKEKGLWDKFLDWLEAEPKKKPKKVKKKPKKAPKKKVRKKSKKGAWKRFMDWLEEE